ncbi:hypothetical protein [Streptomyces sp. NPDC048425]|uniref:hypothetical protein n=1 Tax=Streptomyces sp. NPDC048425 TaxID=3365548 RepID=UPI00371D5013
MSERTEHASGAEHGGGAGRAGFLDFPGAADLIVAGTVAAPMPEVVAAAQAAVAAAARDEATRPTREGAAASPAAVVRSHSGVFPRHRRLLVAAAAVAAIACGAVAYPVLDLGGRPAATASASEFLDQVATVAARGSASQAPYWKVRFETDNQDDAKRTDTRYFDRKGRIWSVGADGTVLNPPAKSAGKTKKWPVGNTWLTWPQLDELPTDADALTARFPDDAEARLNQVTIMLQDSPANPRLRAALFRILADIPGMKLVGDVKDSKGRPGVAVEATRKAGYTTSQDKHSVSYRTSDRYIVDPETGLLLETIHQIRGQDRPADRYTWLEVGPARHVG